MAKMYFVFCDVRTDGKWGRMYMGHRATEKATVNLAKDSLYKTGGGMAAVVWYSYDSLKNCKDSWIFGVKRSGTIDRGWMSSFDDSFWPQARKVIREGKEIPIGKMFWL